jgi:high-affinity nickel permease
VEGALKMTGGAQTERADLMGLGLVAERLALLGTALLAYVLGLRHVLDADHIATIDNVVRKLTQDGMTPIATGLFLARPFEHPTTGG